MTELFREVFLSQGVRIVAQSPQVTLEGTILRAESSPVAFTSDGRASQHRFTVAMAYTLNRVGHPRQVRQAESSAIYTAFDDPADALAAQERAIREAGYALATQAGGWLAEQRLEDVP